jgi:hypothetical protein
LNEFVTGINYLILLYFLAGALAGMFFYARDIYHAVLYKTQLELESPTFEEAIWFVVGWPYFLFLALWSDSNQRGAL